MNANPAEADAIRLSPDDNVATVLRPIAAGETLLVRDGDRVLELRAREAIPLCHKISLTSIPEGAAVIKYGQPIGKGFVSVDAGSHVHVHTMRSARGGSGT